MVDPFFFGEGKEEGGEEDIGGEDPKVEAEAEAEAEAEEDEEDEDKEEEEGGEEERTEGGEEERTEGGLVPEETEGGKRKCSNERERARFFVTLFLLS